MAQPAFILQRQQPAPLLPPAGMPPLDIAVGADLHFPQAGIVNQVGGQILQQMPFLPPQQQQIPPQFQPIGGQNFGQVPQPLANNAPANQIGQNDREVHLVSKGIDNEYTKATIKKADALKKAFFAIEQQLQAQYPGRYLVHYNFHTGEYQLSNTPKGNTTEEGFLTVEEQAQIDDLMSAKHMLHVERYISGNNMEYYSSQSIAPINAPKFQATSKAVDNLKKMTLEAYTSRVLPELLPPNTSRDRIQQIVMQWKSAVETHNHVLDEINTKIGALKQSIDSDKYQRLQQERSQPGNHSQTDQEFAAIKERIKELNSCENLKAEIGECDNYALGIQIALHEAPGSAEQKYLKARNLTENLLTPEQDAPSFYERFGVTTWIHDKIWDKKQPKAMSAEESDYAKRMGSIAILERKERRRVERAYAQSTYQDTFSDRLARGIVESTEIDPIDQAKDALSALTNTLDDVIKTDATDAEEMLRSAHNVFDDKVSRARLQPVKEKLGESLDLTVLPANAPQADILAKIGEAGSSATLPQNGQRPTRRRAMPAPSRNIP